MQFERSNEEQAPIWDVKSHPLLKNQPLLVWDSHLLRKYSMQFERANEKQAPSWDMRSNS